MVIITGFHRSGTTFLGNILRQSQAYAYIHEPLNFTYGIKDVKHWYPYINPNHSIEESYYYQLFTNVNNFKLSFKNCNSSNDSYIKMFSRTFIKSKGHLDYLKYKMLFYKKEVLLKDPFFSLCAASFAKHNKDIKVIYLVRHPVAIYESLLRMKWSFNFKHLLNQPSLVKDYKSFLPIDKEAYSIPETSSFLWNIIYKIVYDQTRTLDTDQYYVIRHEDFSIQPEEELQKLFSFLNKPINNSIKEFIHKNMRADTINPNNHTLHNFSRDSKSLAYAWKQNSKKEYEEIIEHTKEIRTLYGY